MRLLVVLLTLGLYISAMAGCMSMQTRRSIEAEAVQNHPELDAIRVKLDIMLAQMETLQARMGDLGEVDHDSFVKLQQSINELRAELEKRKP